jgi:hypothetical protein
VVMEQLILVVAVVVDLTMQMAEPVVQESL